MAPRAIVADKIYLDAFDISGSLNAVAFDWDAQPDDCTVLDGSGARRYSPMLETGKFSMAGLWEGGTDKINEILAGKFGVADTLFTVSPESGADGDAAYIMQVLEAQYDALSGAVGASLKFNASGQISGRAVRGLMAASGVKNATGNGTALTLAGPVLGQKVYAGLHVLAVSGGTLTVKIQSAPTSGFAAPVDRITFAGTAVRGAWWGTPAAGPITDGFWRATWTLTAGTATIAVALGIQ